MSSPAPIAKPLFATLGVSLVAKPARVPVGSDPNAGSPQRELGVFGVLNEAHESAFLLWKMGLLEANGIDVAGADGPAGAGVYWPPPHGSSGESLNSRPVDARQAVD